MEKKKEKRLAWKEKERAREGSILVEREKKKPKRVGYTSR